MRQPKKSNIFTLSVPVRNRLWKADPRIKNQLPVAPHFCALTVDGLRTCTF